MSYFGTLVVGTVTLIIASYFFRRKSRHPNFPPGPKGGFLYGNLNEIRQNDKQGPSQLNKWAAEFGPIYSLQMGSYDVIVLNTHAVVKEAFVKLGDFTYGRATNVFFHRLLSSNYGIIGNDAPNWKTNRRAALSSMRDLGMGKKSMEQKIQDEAQALLGLVERQGDAAFDPENMLQYAVNNVICSLVFGERYDFEDAEFQSMSSQLKFIFKHFIASNEMYIPILTPFVLLRLRIMKAMRMYFNLNSFIMDKIRDHRTRFDPDDIKSFVDIYLKAEHTGELKTRNNDKSIVASILELFTNGSETITTTLRWTFIYLVNFPEIQTKCQMEIRQVIGDVKTPCSGDRAHMPYTNATIMEVQRIATIVPHGVPHRTTDTINISGFTIPKDTLLLSNIHGVHMDRSYWGDPETFRPERWINKDGSLIKHESFMPFSAGHRECIGKSLATQEIFIFLASLLQKFTFRGKNPERPPPLTGEIAVTYHPHDYELVANKY